MLVDSATGHALACGQFFGSQEQSDKRKSVRIGRGRAAVTGNKSPKATVEEVISVQ